MAFLKIENPGVADPSAFTLLGASTSRSSDNSNTIGKFGSGNKHGIAVCLRKELSPVVFAGKLCMTFGTVPRRVDTGISTADFAQIQVKYSGKDRDGKSKTATEELSWVVENGAADWTTVDLALREFVSNALDRAIAEGEYKFMNKWITDNGITNDNVHDDDVQTRYGSALKEYRKTACDWKNVSVEVVADNQVRAKDGTTRVFVPCNAEVFAFYENLGRWFLHFSEPELLNQAILPKNRRNLDDKHKRAVVYRRGVRVREFESSDVPSLFDYNLNNLEMDESRRVDDWKVKHAAARALQDASQEQLQVYLHSMLSKETVWEHTFDEYGLTTPYENKEKTEERKQRWNSAVKSVFTEDTVFGTTANKEFAERKGFKVITVNEAFAKSAAGFGLRTPEMVLTQDDREGRTIVDATPDAIFAVDWIWDCIERNGMTMNKKKPDVKCFQQSMNAGSITWGFYRGDDTVYLNLDLGTEATVLGGFKALSQMFLTTTLEELCHHVTGATDNSRDFQDWILNLAVKLALEGK